MNIQTERLFIEPLGLKHTAFIHRLLNSKGWLQFIGDRNIRTQTDAENYIRKITTNNDFQFLVFGLLNTFDYAGIVTMIQRDYLQLPDLGFAILPDFEGNGFAYEASLACLNIWQTVEQYQGLFAIVQPNNIKSIGLLEKLGFCFQDKLQRDHETLKLFKIHKTP